MKITTEQYDAVEPLILNLINQDGYVDSDKLRLEIRRHQDAGTIIPIFAATIDELEEDYEFNVINALMDIYERKDKVKWLGVATRQTQIPRRYYPLTQARREPLVAQKAHQEYLTGLKLIETYAPYASSWHETLDDVLLDLHDLEGEITQSWK